ncbi:DUF3846 domain-containing protein [Fodinicola acaciae]|uniref:DUF3846 domain-containing protein n=1 Tax=Fodinicola acaciae TaxID=2681555 RepID=UPI001C9E4238|nr:DUF3846 domain-containing protein [Fodinicola acaciae]
MSNLITALHVPADVTRQIEKRQVDNQDIDAYQAAVGGHLEAVQLEQPSATLYANEEGKLLEMPVNERATALMWLHNRRLRNQDVLCGDALLVGPPDPHGDDLSAPEHYVDLVEAAILVIEAQFDSESGWQRSNGTFSDWFQAYRYALGATIRWPMIREVRVIRP